LSIKTTSLDLGADAIIEEAANLKKQFVKVGVQAGSGTYKGKKRGRSAKLVVIASTHEFGTKKAGRNKNITIPERSFIRSTVDEKTNDWNRQAAGFIEGIKAGRETAKGLLQKMGMIIEADIKKKIKSNIPPPLKIRIGGIPLWDTGQLINSIRYVTSLGDEGKKI
jgi:Fe2+ transport system protein FeoA